MSLRIAGGAVYFNPKVNGALQGYMKFGSTQGFPITINPTKLPSYNNDDSGIGTKEADTLVRVDRTATMPTRGITMEMLALAFGADAVSDVAQSAGSLSETLVGIKQGRYYQLGVTPTFKDGARMLSAESLSVSATPMVLNTDYEIDLESALAYIIPGSLVATEGSDVDVAATIGAAQWQAVISGDAEAVGEMKIVGRAATGEAVDYFFPSVSLSLNGEFQVKSDPENPAYQQIPFAVEILEDTAGGRAAVYLNGKPQ